MCLECPRRTIDDDDGNERSSSRDETQPNRPDRSIDGRLPHVCMCAFASSLTEWMNDRKNERMKAGGRRV